MRQPALPASLCVSSLHQTHAEICASVSAHVCVSCRPHRPTRPSAISTGASSGSRRQLNRRPGGQSSGRKQTHLRQSGLCGGMTYAPTCQPGLAGFDSPGAAAAPPVHYVLACIVPLSRSECWLLVQREICTSESMS